MRKFGGRQGGQGQHPFFNEDIFGDFFSGFQGQGGDMDFNRLQLHKNQCEKDRHFRSRPGKSEVYK